MVQFDEQTVSGNVLADARKKTEKILNRKNLSEIDRINFENQNLILFFTEVNNKRISEMYGWYQKGVKNETRWEPRLWEVLRSIILLGIGYFVAGK